jgi:putative tryptophan/tyrosine transport system substrate-binding protein
MNRRRFLAATLSLPVLALLAHADQHAKVARIGWLSAGNMTSHRAYVEAFREAMRELGYEENRDYVIEFQWGDEHAEPFSAMARELMSHGPDLVLTTCAPSSQAVLDTSNTVPIVMTISDDPVGRGLVKNLSRPGGNITGLATRSEELAGKRIELLKEALPGVRRIGITFDPSHDGTPTALAEARRAAAQLSVELLLYEAIGIDDYARVLAEMKKAGADAMLVLPGGSINFRPRRELANMALQERLPSSYSTAEFVEVGGLMSYGPDFRAMFRRTAAYVDKILRGAKPAEMPVEEPTRFELAVNLRTARALGIVLPQSLLIRADRVVQ